ncbi:MAG: glycosyltransferase family 4 protein [Clostridia bacterium]|nr:glycosyltransferase family 4 protein [Clostridia bacterium]
MKILFYNYALNMGGIERTIAMLAQELSVEHEVCFAQFTADDPFYELPENVLRVSFGFSASGNRLIRTANLFLRIVDVFRTVRPDVVFCMNKTHLPLFCTVSRFFGATVIGAERSNPRLHRSKRDLRLRQKSVRADGFVFQTERAKSAYPEQTQKKGTVIPNAICNPDALEPYFGEKKPTFVSVGRLEKVKGYDLLIRAFSTIADRLPDWDLVIYGEGNERRALEELVDSLGLSGRVRLPGADMHAFLKARECEIFVLSSRSEGMPNALLEALSCGLACVSYDCENGPRELIEHETNGLLVEAENVESLADAMLRLAQDGELRLRLSENGRNVSVTHSPSAIAQRWLAYAKQIMNSKE